MWNALKLIKGWEGRQNEEVMDSETHFAVVWMEQRLAQVSGEVSSLFKDFRLSEALKTIYSLIWDDFCSWYLEWIKPGMDQPVHPHVYQRTVELFESLLQLLHPYLPFVTEEIYHQLRQREVGDDLIQLQLPVYTAPDESILKQGTLLKELISTVRDVRNKNGLKPKETIKLWMTTDNAGFYESASAIIRKSINAEHIGFTDEPKPGTIAAVVQTDKLYLEAELAAMDTDKQRADLEKELDYLRGFLASVDKKLGNDRFVQNAKPEVIESERKKKADAEAKIQTLQESMSLL